MYCRYLKFRTKKYNRYMYCSIMKKEIQYKDCNKCDFKEFKEIRAIRNQSKKQMKKEKNRYSIITDDLTKCYLCNGKKKDIHETIGGCNRQKSIEWGLTIPICRKCHSELENNQELKSNIQQLGQKVFENKYNHKLFMSEFKRNYL